MDSDTILREIPGAVGILVVLLLLSNGALALVIRALWGRQNVLQDKLFDVQQDASEELRATQAATNAALSANAQALSAATTAMTASVNELRRHSG